MSKKSKNKINSIIENFTITNYIPFEDKAGLDNLNYVNLIFGKNGVGKTKLSKLFENFNKSKEDGKIKIKYYKGESQKDKEILVFNKSFVEKYFFRSKTTIETGGKFLPAHESFGSKENIEIKEKIEGFNTTYLKNIQEINELVDEIKEEGCKIQFRTKQMESFYSFFKKEDSSKQKYKEKIIEVFKKVILCKVQKRFVLKPNIKSEIEDIIEDAELEELFQKPEKYENDLKTNNFNEMEKKYLEMYEESKEYKNKQLKQVKIGGFFDKKMIEKLKNLENFNNYELNNEKFIPKNLKNDNNYFNWLEIAWNFYTKNVDIKKTTCLLCWKANLNWESFGNLLDIFKTRVKIGFDNLENELQKIDGKGGEIEREENIIEELKKKISNWEIIDWKSKQNEIEVLFNEYKSKCTKIWVYFKETKNWKNPNQENIIEDLKIIIKNLNKKIKKYQNQITEKFENRKKNLKKVAEKILSLILSKEKIKLEEQNFKKAIKKWDECVFLIEKGKNEEKKMKGDDKIISDINGVLEKNCKFHFKLKREKNVTNEKFIYKIESTWNNKIETNDLSDGEKTILSFLYFIHGECKNEIKKKEVNDKNFVIFIDDPTSSLTEENSDVIRREIFQQIEYFKDYKNVQYIITSHKFHFIYQLKRQISHNQLTSNKIFQKEKGENKFSNFKENNDKIFYFYHESWKSLKKRWEAQDILELPNIMRKIIEGFMWFYGKETAFSKFLANVMEEATDAEKGYIKEYSNMFDIINQYSHSSNVKDQSIVEEKIKNSYKTFVKFFEFVAKEHFNQMEKQIGN